MTVLAFTFVLVVLVWVGILLAFAGPLVARWREPVLRHPVLIIESDDWGAGPLQQAAALTRLAAMLEGVRDRSGRSAVMTLGVVLEIPDGERIAASDCSEYHVIAFTDARFDGLRAAMFKGIDAGVFVPQLHGQCHYWPSALLAAARHDSAVKDWLISSEFAVTEDLPSHLQSRWVDASGLPSNPLASDAIQLAAAAEAAAYQAVFGCSPQVAVATTFVWNDEVEIAWRKTGVEVIITPGQRATCRNAKGHPGCVDMKMLTGERSIAEQTYLVRDVYFEPSLGHTPERLVDGLLKRTSQGRACLVETHRFNFLRAQDSAFDALKGGLLAGLKACPDLCFLAPQELAYAIRERNPNWVAKGFKPRLAAWCARLDEIPRFRKIARLSGLALPLAWLERIA